MILEFNHYSSVGVSIVPRGWDVSVALNHHSSESLGKFFQERKKSHEASKFVSPLTQNGLGLTIKYQTIFTAKNLHVESRPLEL